MSENDHVDKDTKVDMDWVHSKAPETTKNISAGTERRKPGYSGWEQEEREPWEQGGER